MLLIKISWYYQLILMNNIDTPGRWLIFYVVKMLKKSSENE